MNAQISQRLRLARLRRRVSTVQMAERMGVSRDTLNRLEKGDAAIALGTYLRALRVLGVDRDINLLAQDDELGRKLHDLALDPSPSRPKRAPRPTSGPSMETPEADRGDG